MGLRTGSPPKIRLRLAAVFLHGLLVSALLAPALHFVPAARTMAMTGISGGSEAAMGTANPGSVPPSLLLDENFIRDVRAAIDELYNRNLDSALDLLSAWQQAWPEHPIWPMWKALDAWWPILIDLENTTYDEAFLVKAEQVIKSSEKILELDPDHMDALIVRSVMNGLIARFHSNRHRWYRSFLHGRRALRDFFHLENEHPDMPDLQFGLGTYRYFTAFLVEEYAIARRLRWMLPSGDRAEGLERLAVAADSSVFVEPEATYFLGHIYLHFENQPGKALGYLRDLYHRYPNNSYYRRLYIRSLYQLNHHSNALSAIEESLAHPFEPDSHESMTMQEDLFTIRGLIRYYYQADFRMAEHDFLEAVALAEQLTPFAERSNLLISLYYLGEISIHNGRRDMARFYFSRAATPDITHPHAKRARDALRTHRLN
jgi:tetratricopeptide (TPR) repeat protein